MIMAANNKVLFICVLIIEMQTKSILRKKLLKVISISFLCLTGCTVNKDYSALNYVDFTDELYKISQQKSLTTQQFRELKNKHGRFFQLWFNEVMDLGMYSEGNDSLGALILYQFAQKNKPVYNAIKMHYSKYPQLMEKTSNVFGRLNDLLGNVGSPVIYSYFSQFSNYRSFVDSSRGKTILAFSSEMFMNDTFPLYKLLEVEEFYNRYNSTDQIPSALLWNYLKGRFESDQKPKNMLEEAVFNGKIWYTMEQVLGEEEIWKHFGYKESEWKEMMQDEGRIWKLYLDQKLLYNSNFSDYKRYFAYGNYTYGGGLPDNYPPQVGNFTGYRIVKAYAENHKPGLAQLWNEKDAAILLKKSSYNPIK